MPITKHALRLADIKDEDAPERLIEIIQNHSGKIPKAEREDAIVVLIRRFQYLIRRNVYNLYNGYKLKDHGWELEDLMQEAFLEFCHLVCHDFKIKENLDDTGLAVFGNYIKVKLYRRLQYGIQEKLRRKGWDAEKLVDIDGILRMPVPASHRGVYPGVSNYADSTGISTEITEAILANALNYEDVVLDHMTNQECLKILREVNEIGKAILDERDYQVWWMYFFGEENVVEIGAKIQNKIDDGSIGRSRVLQIAKSANARIIQEFGRRSACRRTAI